MLQIVYQNGESRIISPTALFFAAASPAVLHEKVKGIIADCGKYPHRYTLSENGVVVLDVTNNQNAPRTPWERKMSKKEINQEKKFKNEMRKQFKRTPFDQKIVFSSDGVVSINLKKVVAQA